MSNEYIVARRITVEEYLAWLSNTNLEYVDGQVLTRSGHEVFFGVKEFPESIREIEQEREERSHGPRDH